MSGPRPIGRTVPGIAEPVLGKRGLAFGSLITEWDTIVGPSLARQTQPEKLSFPRGKREDATLSIRAMGAIALELQHLEPLILERINGFFGYKAVARLRLIHAALPSPPPRRTRMRELSMSEEMKIAETTAAVEDPGLREALERLGRSMLARPKR
jgi:hypothetical protein